MGKFSVNINVAACSIWRASKSVRSAGYRCLARDLPGRDWFYESVDLDLAEIEIFELRSRDRLCATRDNNAAGLRERLQPGGKIRGVAEDAMLLGNPAVRHI